jgi:poly(hydroxyalkanoate) granule-associated protein
MVKKAPTSSARSAKAAPAAADAPLAGAIRDSAQQIWQAGLGAFHRAQAEGGKAFDALVKEGVTLQRKSQSAAEEKIAEATSKMSSLASELSAKAGGQWDRLENIFEDRVAKALHKLSVPLASDLAALNARIDALEQRLPPRPAAGRAAAKAKPAARRAVKRKPT